MSDEEGQKKELLDLLSKAPEEASRLEKLAGEIEKSARFVGEIAPAPVEAPRKDDHLELRGPSGERSGDQS